MKMTLTKMGLNFLPDYNKGSDVGNYRVRAEFTDKKGIKVTADFGGYERKEKRGKKYVVVDKNALYVDGTYYDVDGCGRDYSYMLRENGFDFNRYNYTVSGILDFLSDVTGMEYNEVEFVR